MHESLTPVRNLHLTQAIEAQGHFRETHDSTRESTQNACRFASLESSTAVRVISRKARFFEFTLTLVRADATLARTRLHA
jgi:hypothetical protein